MATSTLAPARPVRHGMLPDKADRLAKADVMPHDLPNDRERLARIIAGAIAVCGWSVKEAAAKLEVDPAELSRWLSTERRPQFDRLWAVVELRVPLLVGLARTCTGATVETRIVV